MNILLDAADVTSEHIHLCDLDVLLHADYLTDLKDGFVIFELVQVGYITGIKNIVYILKHLLVDDLSVDKQERGLLVVNTSLHEGFFDILTPIAHTVSLDDFDLEELVVGNESG